MLPLPGPNPPHSATFHPEMPLPPNHLPAAPSQPGVTLPVPSGGRCEGNIGRHGAGLLASTAYSLGVRSMFTAPSSRAGTTVLADVLVWIALWRSNN